MKKLIFAAMAVFMLFAMVGCGGGDDPEPTPTPKATVSSVTVTAAGNATSVAPGGTLQFSASVTGTNKPAQTVTWTIDPAVNGASISTAGLLTVGSGVAHNTSITVKATSTVDTTKSDTKTITVVVAGQPAVTAVVVEPLSVAVEKGQTRQFTVEVTAVGGAAETVTWSIVESGKSDDTTIVSNANGALLTVDVDEPLDALTVRATSTVSTSVYGESEVTLMAAGAAYVETVTISPTSATVEKGEDQQFTVTVVAHNGADETVTWSIVEAGTDSATNISTTGLLSVSAHETLNSLTVKAVSVATPAVFDEVTVTLTGGIRMVTITFDPDYDNEPTFTQEIESGQPVEDAPAGWLPELERLGWLFDGWYPSRNGSGSKVVGDTTFSVATTLYANWIEDVLTGSDAWEALYLENGASAIYKFTIPAGKTLGDYKNITAEYKVSGAGLAAWEDGQVFHVRLLGVYTEDFITTNQSNSLAPNPEFNQSVVKYLARGSYSTPYIIDDGNSGSSVLDAGVTANEWFEVTYVLDGSRKNAAAESSNFGTAKAGLEGDVYFALGISNQDSNKGADRHRVFFQLIKDVTLVPVDEDDDAVTATIPDETLAQFVCYNDPIVFAWRGDPDLAELENMPYIYIEPEPPVNRGDEPAAEDLREVLLGEPGYTYIHSGGNRNNQKGWVSFGEAGRAEAQDWKTTDGGITNIPLDNFKNAWYLVIETTSLPTGRFDTVWLGDKRAWVQKQGVLTSEGTAAANMGATIEPKEGGGGYIIKFFLPKSLAYYYYYFDETDGNQEWAGLGFSYWGASNANIDNLGITKAYLLVDKDEVKGPAEGVSLGLSFALSEAPADGAVIGDVVLNASGELIVSAAPGLTEYQWYIDGVKSLTDTGINLKIATPVAEKKYVISLQAKRGGKWVSQTVVVTVAE
jgi:hypothetical protein